MKDEFDLRIELLSDGTFGKGSGLPGRVDTEVQYDVKTGLPFVRGQVVKGLLVESCATVLQSVRLHGQPGVLQRLREAAAWLFGRPGSRIADEGKLDVGPGLLPAPLRKAVASDVEAGRYSTEAAREALTAVRRQTAVDDVTGAPKEGSLRGRRVLLRQTTLTASLSISGTASKDALSLLRTCARLVRRGGLRRSRGNAWLDTNLADARAAVGGEYADHFRALVRGEDPAPHPSNA